MSMEFDKDEGRRSLAGASALASVAIHPSCVAEPTTRYEARHVAFLLKRSVVRAGVASSSEPPRRACDGVYRSQAAAETVDA